MNLVLVGGSSIKLKCAHCGKEEYSTPAKGYETTTKGPIRPTTPYYADIEGIPWVSYYCDSCIVRVPGKGLEINVGQWPHQRPKI